MTPRVLCTRGVMHWWYSDLSSIRREAAQSQEREMALSGRGEPSGELRSGGRSALSRPQLEFPGAPMPGLKAHRAPLCDSPLG